MQRPRDAVSVQGVIEASAGFVSENVDSENAVDRVGQFDTRQDASFEKAMGLRIPS
jgi:hypothetical protein